MERRKDEPLNKFLARNFCSTVCRNRGQVAKFPPKHCKGCGAVLIRRSNENANKFAVRLFCNMTCRGRWQSAVAENRLALSTKLCPCGTVFTRGSHRSVADFERRKFCSLTCSSKSRLQSEKVTEHNPNKRRAAPAAPVAGPYRYGRVYHRPVKPPKPGTPFQSPEDWLKTHEITRVPPAYCAPVIGAGIKS